MADTSTKRVCVLALPKINRTFDKHFEGTNVKKANSSDMDVLRNIMILLIHLT